LPNLTVRQDLDFHLVRARKTSALFTDGAPGGVDLRARDLAALDGNPVNAPPGMEAEFILKPTRLHAIPILPDAFGWMLGPGPGWTQFHTTKGMFHALHLGPPLKRVRDVLPSAPPALPENRTARGDPVR
jgi:hypothetical protein